MRKALIGILMAATMATPLAAQDNNNGWRHNGESRGDRGQGRAERGEGRGGGQWRQQQQQQQQQAQQQQAQPQQQAPQQQAPQQQNQRQWSRGQGEGQRQQWQGNGGQNWQGNRGGNWRGGGERQALEQRIQEARDASRQRAEGLSPRYQRQAERNQQRTEEQLRRNYQQDRRGDRYRDDRRDNRDSWDNGGQWGRNDGRYGQRSYSWSRNWRNDNRYDWQRYRYSNRNAFHRGPYYAPYRGYGYNRLGIGIVLDSLFYSRNYWIDDPFDYRLPPTPPGTQWIRYYNDVVLVDVYSGEVVDVIYDFFW